MGTTVAEKKENISVKNKVKRIALVGNPNSGKTTLYNSLTGTVQYVGNWPGVTVEKKEGKLKGYDNIIVTDLPGIYSLSPYTLEEVITRNYLIVDDPDVIINIVDATNLERNLYLTMQLSELGIPVVVALNMIDIVKKKGDIINVDKLAKITGCKVLELSALKGTGVKEVMAEAAKLAETHQHVESTCVVSPDIELSLTKISDMIRGNVPNELLRWYTIKLFERDQKVLGELKISGSAKDQLEKIITEMEKKYDDDCESIITNERYNFITGFIKSCITKKNTGKSTSARIDEIVTNRILAIPIFVVVIALIYYISISTVGAWGTDWVNDVLFGDIVPGAVESFLTSVGAADWLMALILDGIVGGVGAVLGFLPQLAVLFLLLAILEDVGYMARIAFILDKVFRKFGLSGKSIIPILIGTGCGIPGVMASRTIENENDRKITVMTTTFIPCGAKLPIIALISGAMFGGSFWIAISAYFIGIFAIMLSGIILKKFKAFISNPSPFVMELPAYHAPSIKNVLLYTWDKIKSFVKKAGTLIFVACIIIWFLSNFNFKFEMVDAGDSILAILGGIIAPLFAPLGWGDWQSAVATITGLVAKENVVGTMAVLMGHMEEISEEGQEIWTGLQSIYTPLSAYSFLLFNLLCAPCFAAIGAIRREMGNAKWTWISLGYQTALAYAAALCTYQIGMLISGTFSAATVFAFIVLAFFIYMLVRPAAKVSTAK